MLSGHDLASLEELAAAPGARAHREQIVRELITVYRPGRNDERDDNAWRDEWTGEYSGAPTAGPVRGTERKPRD